MVTKAKSTAKVLNEVVATEPLDEYDRKPFEMVCTDCCQLRHISQFDWGLGDTTICTGCAVERGIWS